MDNKTFQSANEKVHPVETQWHYAILTRHGFTPVTREATGFVRSYRYVHPSGLEIVCTTGVNRDYWTNPNGADVSAPGTSWSKLEPYIVSLGL